MSALKEHWGIVCAAVPAQNTAGHEQNDLFNRTGK